MPHTLVRSFGLLCTVFKYRLRRCERAHLLFVIYYLIIASLLRCASSSSLRRCKKHLIPDRIGFYVLASVAKNTNGHTRNTVTHYTVPF